MVGDLLGRCSFPPAGTAVTCAVSGGADSLALLVLAVAAGLEATAIHVDHGLRPCSAGEAAVVEAAASVLGAGFRSVAVSVGQGPNLEARARAARYAALPPGVLTGHTADDLAETVLINLLRGAGLDGLAPMRSGARVGRPLLRVRRFETRALCAVSGFTPVTDESNDDPRFTRNRVRHELLPLLSDIAGRDPVPVLARQATLFADEAAVLDALAAGFDPTDARAARDQPPAILRRAVRAWLRGGCPEEHPPSAAEVERVLAVIRGDATACELAGGRTVRRSQGRLSIH